MSFGGRFGARSAAVFATLWLSTGFALGTIVLLGPVRMLVSGLRRHGVSETIEKLSVVACIAVLMMITTAVAVALTRVVLETPRKLLRLGLPLIVFASAFGAYLAWMNPTFMKSKEANEEQIARFTFGPYPEYDKLQELKREGYTGVISLLHPAVVPFEPQLLSKETKNANAAGMRLIHLPMLPWISDNTSSLDRLRELAKANDGRYYVHCYLGVDRVMLAKRIVEQNAPGVKTNAVSSSRSLSDVKSLERGAVVALDATTYLTPYPTPEEFVSYILAGGIEHVIALLDPKDEDAAVRIADEQKIMQAHSVPFTLVPMSAERYDPARMLVAARQVQQIPGRKVVHSFFGPDHRHGAVAAAFESAFRTGRAPILRSITTHSLGEKGSITLPQPHLAVGPMPAANELGGLRRYGVRAFVCVGKACDALQRVAVENQWPFLRADATSLAGALSGEGPFYVFGRDAEPLVAAVAGASR